MSGWAVRLLLPRQTLDRILSCLAVGHRCKKVLQNDIIIKVRNLNPRLIMKTKRPARFGGRDRL